MGAKAPAAPASWILPPLTTAFCELNTDSYIRFDGESEYLYGFLLSCEDGTLGERNDLHSINNNFSFFGPQLLVNSKGDSLNLELDLRGYDDTQSDSIPSSVNMHPFHGGLTQQWLIHDDGNGGAAIMSRYNRMYVVPTIHGDILSANTPYFWEIFKDGGSYRFAMQESEELCLCLGNSTAKLARMSDDFTPIYILKSTPENQAAIQRKKFVPFTLLNNTAASVGVADINMANNYSSASSLGSGTRSPLMSDAKKNAIIYHRNSISVFPSSIPGLPSTNIFDTIATGRECTGFPTGYFRIRAVGIQQMYWSLYRLDSSRDGNPLVLRDLPNENEESQVFYINGKGELCTSGGHIDVTGPEGNTLIIAKTRAPTLPWPNPWSHPLPTFSYSKETKGISVRFYADPMVSGQWPRPEKEWKDKEFLVAAQCTAPVKACSFNEVSRWVPNSRFPKWTERPPQWKANEACSMGVEEKQQTKEAGIGYPITSRFKWEIEQV